MSGAGPAPPSRPSFTGERRVTLDLDDADPIDVVSAFYSLRHEGAHEIEARVSSGGEGFHVRAWFDADDLDEAGVETLRRLHGDHARRTDMDREHHVKPGQILFTRKPDGEAGPWRHDPYLAVDDMIARRWRRL